MNEWSKYRSGEWDAYISTVEPGQEVLLGEGNFPGGSKDSVLTGKGISRRGQVINGTFTWQEMRSVVIGTKFLLSEPSDFVALKAHAQIGVRLLRIPLRD